MIVITGWRSTIAQAFRMWLPPGETCVRAEADNVPVDAERYLFCHGILRPKQLAEQTPDEVAEGYRVNFETIRVACDAIIAANRTARICIIGSESGYRGSFDGVYAAAKRDLHEYIETVELRSPDQQIVGISPGIIADSGMTQRRTDQLALERRAQEHPKRRFLTAKEVASMAIFLLFGDAGYTSGTVIRMHGGLQ